MKYLSRHLFPALLLAVLAVVVSSPNPGATKNHIQSVGATSNSDVWAVGNFNNTATNPGNGAGGDRTLIEHWNGQAWSTPVALPAGVSQLQSVVALSPTNAWAAGVINNSASQLLHWNGTKWSIVAGPTLPRGNTVTFTDLSASSASDIWAIG